jgi:hypothetical protein
MENEMTNLGLLKRSINHLDLFRTLRYDETTLKRLIKAPLIAEGISQTAIIDGK